MLNYVCGIPVGLFCKYLDARFNVHGQNNSHKRETYVFRATIFCYDLLINDLKKNLFHLSATNDGMAEHSTGFRTLDYFHVFLLKIGN